MVLVDLSAVGDMVVKKRETKTDKTKKIAEIKLKEIGLNCETRVYKLLTGFGHKKQKGEKK